MGPSVQSLARRERVRTVAAVLGVMALIPLAVWVSGITRGNLPIGSLGMILLFTLPALLVWLWKDPVRGLYIIFGAAVIQETQLPPRVYPDDIGSYVYFFEDIATWTHIKGISFSVAELLMLLVLLVWGLKAIAERGPRFDRGSLMLPLGVYSLLVLLSEFHGLLSGGVFKTSLWEIRPQAYMLIAYILACNLVKKRSQVWALIWILVIGTGLKAIQGVIRYRISLGGNLHSVESLFPHEQSFFFNGFIVFALIAVLYGASPRMKKTVLWLTPVVIVADLANQRRASVLALAIALLMLLIVTAIAHPPARRAALWVLLTLAVLFPPYYAYYQNKSGLLAEPARAVASNFHPDPRDASSNLYRVNEDADIMATMKSSVTTAAIGYGFGKPMLTPYPLANIAHYYVFWNIMPHNSILWIWMRLGTIGYLVFWFLIGMAIVQASRLLRRLADPALRGLALLIILMTVQEVIFGYLDLQWTNYRNLIVMGVLFALISRLALFAKDESRASSSAEPRSEDAPRPGEPESWREPIGAAGGRW